jgi:hypothetical protein
MSVNSSSNELDFEKVARVWSERLHLLMQEGGAAVAQEGPLILALLQAALQKDGIGVFCALMAITDGARDRAREEEAKRLEVERHRDLLEEQVQLERELHVERLEALRQERPRPGFTVGAAATTPEGSTPVSPIQGAAEVTWLMGEVV